LTSSSNPAVLNQPLTLTATITPSTATGTVTFYDTSTLLATGNITNGVATVSVATLSAGQHSLIAYYSGDSNVAVSFSTFLTQQVVAATNLSLTSSVNPSAYG